MELDYYRKTYQEVERLFEGVPDEKAQQFQIVKYRKGVPLIEAGQYDDQVFIILEGLASIIETYPSGLRMTYYKLTVGNVCGFYEVLADRPKRVATVLAMTDVVAAVLPKKAIIEIFDSLPWFTRKLCFHIIDRYRETGKLIVECSNFDIFRATVTYLLFSYKIYQRQQPVKSSDPVRIGDSRQEIAEYLGADVRSVNRAVEKLKSSGLVTIIKGKIHIDKEQYGKLTMIKDEYIQPE